MGIITIVNRKTISPDFMQERIERRLTAYAELNELDLIDALDKCIDIALLWHRTSNIVKFNILKEDKANYSNRYYSSESEINKYYRG